MPTPVRLTDPGFSARSSRLIPGGLLSSLNASASAERHRNVARHGLFSRPAGISKGVTSAAAPPSPPRLVALPKVSRQIRAGFPAAGILAVDETADMGTKLGDWNSPQRLEHRAQRIAAQIRTMHKMRSLQELGLEGPSPITNTPQIPSKKRLRNQHTISEDCSNERVTQRRRLIALKDKTITARANKKEKHRASSGAWNQEDDMALLQLRAMGKNWNQIQREAFPGKTGNACRKRHERLMERQIDFDNRKLERMSKEYMSMRKELWQPLAQRCGEKWNVIEMQVC
jgi:hypothetical protein